MAACKPTLSPPAPPLPQPKAHMFNTWQESAAHGTNDLKAMLDSGFVAGSGVNPDSLTTVVPGFGMPRFMLDFNKVANALPSQTLDQLIGRRRSLVGIMTGHAMAITVIENTLLPSGKWRVATMGNQSITNRVNEVFADVPMAEVDSMVMYEVHNLRARAFKVITVDGRTLFYTGFGMPDGTLLQSTEPAIITSFKNAANAFLLANPGVLGNDSISG